MFRREKRVLLRHYLDQGAEGGDRPPRRREPEDGLPLD